VHTINKQTITIDLKRSTIIPLLRFIQGDTNQLEIVIKDNGQDADFSNIGRIVTNFKRKDRKVISRLLTNDSNNIVLYQFGSEEMQVDGESEIELQFFSIDNKERISTHRFKVLLFASIGTDTIHENNGDLTLLQELFVEVDEVKISTEAAEATRQQNEITRQNQETKRQTDTSNKINEIETRTTAAIGRIDTVTNENKTIWLIPVANFAAIATTYPNALDGSQVFTLNDSNFYRKINGSWVWTGQYNNNAITDIQVKLADANRQSQTIAHGNQVINATQNSPVDLEIQGRTLISLGNSNLEGGKNYVLADKRTKVRAEGREGTLINGVGKFTKNASLITKADFVGKVSGSVTENPHIAKATGNAVLQTPTGSWAESTQQRYDQITTLNGTISNYGFTSVSGAYAQQLFSYNLIEHIERKHGRIPAVTVAGKVQWIKDNVNKLTVNWHGWASSVGGNKATLAIWNPNTSAWNVTNSNLLGTIQKVTFSEGSAGSATRIDNGGFVHYLAYAEPSDGTTPSQLNTDFVELEIELKSTAVLDTRPIVTRVATFEGKVSGSTVENPHVAKRSISQTALQTPTGTWTELVSDYLAISSLNGALTTASSVLTNGAYAQHLFSFNLIEEIERNIGRIPKATVAEKVQWVKDNGELLFEWHGFGSSVGGNRASIKRYNVATSTWDGGEYHTSSTVFKRFYSLGNLTNNVDANGLVHFLAHAESSDGTTPSTINTDYVELQITLKQGATLHDPVLSLYEVDTIEYAKILVDWNEAEVLNRYPRVQGVQHLQNVAVIAEGENLLPPFSEWTLHANAKVVSPYELELNASAANQNTTYQLAAIPNRDYYLNTTGLSGQFQVLVYDVNGTQLLANYSGLSKGFTTPSNATRIEVRLTNGAVGTGKFTFTNPMLTLGNTPKPFVPRNPSYLFAPVKLGQIGSVKDSLYNIGTEWFVRKLVEKDVVLDGSLGWLNVDDLLGYKRVQILQSSFNIVTTGGVITPSAQVLTKHDGKVLTQADSSALSDRYNTRTPSVAYIVISVSDLDTGFPEVYVPSSDDWKRYFNGWKYTDGTTWTSVTGNGQTANGATALSTKPTDFTPYKLSYVLSTPQLINVNHLVEGAINVSGQTQVEIISGVVVREKVNVYIGTTNNHINHNTYEKLKNKAARIMTVYRNGQVDKRWAIVNDTVAFGISRASIPVVDFDPSAEYTVTYLVLDRHLQTVNAMDVKASYAGSLKDSVDMAVVDLTDLKTQVSVNGKIMVDMLARLKALEVK
jgi:hypothetical protein